MNHPAKSTLLSEEPALKRPKTSASFQILSPEEISANITNLAAAKWAESQDIHSHVVGDIYSTYICSQHPIAAVSALDNHDYFATFLWPQFCHLSDSLAPSTLPANLSTWKPHAFSIIALFNFRQDNHPARASDFLQCFDLNARAVNNILEALFRLDIQTLSLAERCMRVSFLIHLFRALDHDSVRRALLPLLSLPVWLHLSDSKQTEQLKRFSYLRKPLSKLQRRAKKRNQRAPVPLSEYAIFSLVTELEAEISRFFFHLRDESLAVICELVSLFTELLSQLRLRRTLLPLLSDRHTLYLVQGLTLELNSDAAIHALQWWQSWLRIIDLFAFYFTFPLDPLTGETLSRDAVREERAKRLLSFQRVCHAVCQRESLAPQHQLRTISLLSHSVIGNAQLLRRVFTQCEKEIITYLTDALQMNTVVHALGDTNAIYSEKGGLRDYRKLMQSAMASYCHIGKDALESFRTSPEMITEEDLWGPLGANERRLIAALPTLNLEFLNLDDYLLRNFTLFKMESAWAIREDIEDTVCRLRPTFSAERIKLDGWAKMAVPLLSVTLEEVGDVLLDSDARAHVKLQIEADLTHLPNNTRREWSDLQQHEVLFLVKFGGVDELCHHGHEQSYNREEYQKMLSKSIVRGFVIDALDSSGPDMKTNIRERGGVGSKLKLSGLVDNVQYQLDSKGEADAYKSFLKDFTIVVRRRAEVNNFFPILKSLRDLLLSDRQILPGWIASPLLGRFRQGSEKGSNEPDEVELDFADSFVSESHLISSFQDLKLDFLQNEIDGDIEGAKNRTCYKIKFGTEENDKMALVKPYQYRFDKLGIVSNPKKTRVGNTIPFSEAQIRAIHSGLKQGLTLISGSPGTGKTSVIVQIVSTLYHSKPRERILVITRTNHALNDLVEKFLEGDIDPLRVLRLGQGESNVSWNEPISKEGRINALLQKRLLLLSEVARLSNSMESTPSIPTDWSCEAATALFENVIKKEWESFKKSDSEDWHTFPFRRFMEGHRVLGNGEMGQEKEAPSSKDPNRCYVWISRIFEELQELSFLEVFRSNRQRGSYLVTAYARIIAMTCVHAAMQREELVSQRFAYDSVVMEEAAECLEAETFLSFVLQPTERLKRVVLIGDHKQLPPVVQNRVLQQKSNFGQSMFTRLVRAGHDSIQLCHQGRSRSSIANLFRWRYKNLEDMVTIREDVTFTKANPGFLYVAQFIDTGEGNSETQPIPHYYQNLVEAEYIAFTFLYMRILGYQCENIAVLATYNGQVDLLKEVISARAAQFGNAGMPFAISTVDKFQGRQADYVLLSLVKTKTLGHFRDIRRMTVAVSRARYGLYIFGYFSLFSSNKDFTPLFQALSDNNDLTLVAGETFVETTREESDILNLSDSRIRPVHSPADMAAIVSHLYDSSNK